ncbi:MAG TPA: hypothetical protein PK445_07210 [Methanolinea sp.]|nr:hypothetical protein [Methanolinea sp.]
MKAERTTRCVPARDVTSPISSAIVAFSVATFCSSEPFSLRSCFAVFAV